MAISITSKESYGTLTRDVYSDTEIRTAWHELNKQGNRQARSHNGQCVVKACTESQAVALSRLFISKFAIPTCCHYDGKNLSMYCGDAGSGWFVLKTWLENLRVN